MNVLKPLDSLHDLSFTQGFFHDPTLFLAGSIEMGAAEMWQERVIKDLVEYPGTILNPRRDDWDSSWVQSIENDQFCNQVEWELRGQELATDVCFYFANNTKSPITLMELGLACGKLKKDEEGNHMSGNNQHITVFCPMDFWRRGNIEVMCARYHLDLTDNYGTFIQLIQRRLTYYMNKKAQFRKHYAKIFDLEIPKNEQKGLEISHISLDSKNYARA